MAAVMGEANGSTSDESSCLDNMVRGRLDEGDPSVLSAGVGAPLSIVLLCDSFTRICSTSSAKLVRSCSAVSARCL